VVVAAKAVVMMLRGHDARRQRRDRLVMHDDLVRVEMMRARVVRVGGAGTGGRTEPDTDDGGAGHRNHTQGHDPASDPASE